MPPFYSYNRTTNIFRRAACASLATQGQRAMERKQEPLTDADVNEAAARLMEGKSDD